METLDQKFEKQFKEISEKYPGIKKDDICEMNPWYSCSICDNRKCENIGRKGKYSCPDHVRLDVDTFAKRYDFDW